MTPCIEQALDRGAVAGQDRSERALIGEQGKKEKTIWNSSGLS
jgi:hypothetical protein